MQFAFPPKMPAQQQKSLARKARLIATLFLAKSGSFVCLGYVPDFRLSLSRRADHSGGTVADFHGLPFTPSQLSCPRRV
jgi:hypothetical protein